MALTPKQEKYYVYHLIDPRNGQVFYVGKGSGDRINHHERDARKLRFANTEKESVIHDIWDAGLSVKKEIVARFNVEANAFQFEKSEIFRIGHANLTNVCGGGSGEIERSICKAEKFIIDMKAKAEIFTGKRRELALSLIAEMQENLEMAMRLKARA